jgi:hypothetical protein
LLALRAFTTLRVTRSEGGAPLLIPIASKPGCRTGAHGAVS